MTTVEILYRLAALPTEKVALALARTSDVYGIRRLSLDRQAPTLRVEFDATRGAQLDGDRQRAGADRDIRALLKIHGSPLVPVHPIALGQARGPWSHGPPPQ